MSLSQSPSAIKMRRHRAKYPRLAEPKPRGRRPNLDKHRALVAAVEKVMARRFGSLSVLACDLGYAHSDSLLKSYKFALAALSSAEGERA
jgi:hypothetical protein